MELGVHLPLMQFGEEALSRRRLEATVDAARDCGFAAVSANDHLIFRTPWLDGPTALASVIERSGEMELATTISLPSLRGPVQLAKALAAIDVLSEGRLIAGLGPGSSERDYRLLGIPFEERWPRFDEAVAVLRALLQGEPMPERPRFYPVPPDVELAPGPRRTASRCGSAAGARAPGWPASRGWVTAGSPPPTTRRRRVSPKPVRRSRERSRSGGGTRTASRTRSRRCGRGSRRTGRRAIACSPTSWRRCCGEIPTRSARRSASVPPGTAPSSWRATPRPAAERVYVWPLGDEARQIELIAEAA